MSTERVNGIAQGTPVSCRRILAGIYLHRVKLLAVLISLIGIYFRLEWRSTSAFAGDEQYSSLIFNLPFWQFFKRLPEHDFCGYLNGDYYLLYPFYKVFGANKWGLAIPHLASTLFGFYLFYKMSTIYLKSSLSFLFAFIIFSFNATLVEHALEIRPYAILPTLAMAVFLVFHKIAGFKEKVGFLQQIGLILFFFFVIIFHPYGILMVFFTFLFFFAKKISFRTFLGDLSRLRQYLIPVGMLILPFYILTFLNGGSRRVDDIFCYIPNPLENSIGFLKAIIGNLIGFKPLYPLLIPLLVCLIVPHRQREQNLNFFIYLIILPILTIFAMDTAKHYWFLQRQFIWTMPFCAILLAWTFDLCLGYFANTRIGRKIFFGRVQAYGTLC